MKIIKVRHWDTEVKRFHYLTITDKGFERTRARFHVGVLAEPELMKPEPDRNGKEIFEGDIIRSNLFKNGKKGIQIAIVRIVEGSFTAEYVWSYPKEWKNFEPLGGLQSMYWTKLSEVIGNIHENEDIVKRYRTLTEKGIHEGE